MPTFKWEGKTRNGEVKRGTMDATDEQAVILRLKQQQITPGAIKKSAGALEFKIPGLEPRVKSKSLVIFTRQFATMIDAGLPLVQGLDILAAQNDDKVMQKVLYHVKNDVESGSTFAAALEKHKDVFDDLYISLVSAGELGGILDTILDRLASYIEKAQALKKRVKSAMTYPIVILAVTTIVISVLMIYVIPTFAAMFKDLSGGDLPALTQFVMDLSDWFVKYFPLVIAAGIGLVVAWKMSRKIYRTRLVIDAFFLKIPIFGSLIQKTAVARFTRTLGTMISSGIPILQALDVVEKTAGNLVIEEGIKNVKAKITEGKSMAEPLMATGVFPPMVVQMIAVGESTGALDAMLGKIADFYDEEVDTAVDSLTSVIEPVMMVVLGSIIGFTLVAMYLPIFTMAGQAG
ncbi:MAG: type II secretion system F family protein [Myxococcales bacterium]|nr:MAG: type II secretion system F family protein [Myxococcales bacterium]